jgi:hypothetical protein
MVLHRPVELAPLIGMWLFRASGSLGHIPIIPVYQDLSETVHLNGFKGQVLFLVRDIEFGIGESLEKDSAQKKTPHQ